MYIDADFEDFRQQFSLYHRDNQFSRPGLHALYDYIIECEESMPEHPYILDVLGLCCEYCEYSLADLDREKPGWTPEELDENHAVCIPVFDPLAGADGEITSYILSQGY